MHFRRIIAAALLVGLASLFGLSGCDGCSEEKAPETGSEPEQHAKSEADDSAPDAGFDYDRLIFGLPMPPNVVGLIENEHEVRIKVRMSLGEVGEFFEQNLVDFEILHPRDRIRAIGLREYLPEVYAYPYGPFSFVVYSRGKWKPAEDAPSDEDQKAAPTVSAPDPTSYEKGDPILERTADGRLLAPGARWGEPYTPPPGSPLDKLHFRSNFGKPYGQWTAR
jgi:hypothetical protein